VQYCLILKYSEFVFNNKEVGKMKKMSDKIHWIDEIRQPIRLVKNIICCIHKIKNSCCILEKKNRSLKGHVLTGNECYTINIV